MALAQLTLLANVIIPGIVWFIFNTSSKRKFVYELTKQYVRAYLL